jgi:2'-5' RNA ligase
VRAFFSVEIPSELRGLPPAAPDAPRHLTLAFLADVPEERTRELLDAGAEATARSPPFDLVLGGFGAFPSAERPRIVFVGAPGGAEALTRLASDLRASLAARGLPFDAKPFQPHLTVLRVRRPADAGRAQELLARGDPTPLTELKVREVLVKSSALTQNGAVHTTIGRFPLGGTRA